MKGRVNTCANKLLHCISGARGLPCSRPSSGSPSRMLVSQARPFPFHSTDRFQSLRVKAVERKGLVCETSSANCSTFSRGKLTSPCLVRRGKLDSLFRSSARFLSCLSSNDTPNFMSRRAVDSPDIYSVW